jgi:hypothetical protein
MTSHLRSSKRSRVYYVLRLVAINVLNFDKGFKET